MRQEIKLDDDQDEATKDGKNEVKADDEEDTDEERMKLTKNILKLINVINLMQRMILMMKTLELMRKRMKLMLKVTCPLTLLGIMGLGAPSFFQQVGLLR